MKKVYNTIALCTLMVTFANAQNVGISTSAPDAKLDVVSSNSGILIPRIALTGSNDVSTVPLRTVSEMIYNTATAGSGSTAVTPGFYYWDGSKWERIKVGAEGEDHDWYEQGGTAAPNSISDNVYTQGNVGIGTTTPDAPLDVNGEVHLNIMPTYSVLGQLKFGRVDGVDRTHYLTMMNNGTPNQNYMKFALHNGTVGDSTEVLTLRGDGTVTVDAGNLGVGIDIPTERLHVVGGARITGLGNGIVRSNANGVLSHTALTGSTGDVLRGDGTFGPGSAFGDNLGNHSATTFLNMNENSIYLRNVSGSIYGMGYNAFGGANFTITSDDVITFSESDANVIMAEWSMNSGTFAFKNTLKAYDASGLFLTDDGGTLGLFIEDGGNVGVGNNNPAYTMDFSPAGTLSLNDGYLRNVRAFYLRDWDDDTGGDDDKYRLLARDGAWQFYNGGVVVGNYGNGQWTDLDDGTLIVEGSVGIGETDPADKLVVSGGRVEFTSTTDANGSTGSGVLEIGNGLRMDGNEIITNTNSPLYLQNDNGGDLIVDGSTLVVDASLNRVGVGLVNPASTLEVAGDARISGNNSSLIYENTYETNNEWRLVYSDDFESSTESWICQTVTATGNNGITRQNIPYLGYSHVVRPTNGNDRALKKYFNLSGISCTDIKIEFTYYFLDSWDGENAWVGVGDSESYGSGVRPSSVWNSRWDHNWGDPRSGTNLSYYGNTSHSDASTTATAIFHNNFSGSGFWMFVGSSLNDGVSDETFAIDNVKVYVR